MLTSGLSPPYLPSYPLSALTAGHRNPLWAVEQLVVHGRLTLSACRSGWPSANSPSRIVPPMPDIPEPP
jgi:hypothetical protein